MKEALADSFPDAEIELIKSKGGAFEIRHDQELIYSKIETGEFPPNKDIVKKLQARL